MAERRPFNPDIGKATRFQKGNAAALQTGAYAALVRSRDRQRAAQLAKAGIVQALDEACADHGAELAARQGFALTIAQRGLVRRYEELDGLATYLFAQLMDGGSGPITATGKIKRTFTHYVTVCQQQAKVAHLLGLPKPPRDLLPTRPVLPSLASYRPADADGPA